MAQRVIRRQTFEADWGPDLAAAAATYATEIAWLDWARTLIGRSDANPEVASLYAELIAELDTARAQANEAFVPFGAIAAGSLPEGVVGVEAVLDLVVAPVAAQAPVLLVLDGMGWESFVEFSDISRVPAGRRWPRRRCATRCCRRIAHSHQVLAHSCWLEGFVMELATAKSEHSLKSPRCWPPRALESRRSYSIRPTSERAASAPTETVRSVIADGSQQIVAVVLNNIDERLKDVPSLKAVGLSTNSSL